MTNIDTDDPFVDIEHDEPRTNGTGGYAGEEPPPQGEPEPPLAPLPLIDISRWTDQRVPEREWAVLNRIPLRQVTLHSGHGGAGKSLIEMQRSVAHVLGRDWLGTLPEPGPALFIDAEDDESEMHIRLTDILKHCGMIDEHCAVQYAEVKRKGLHLMSFAGRDAVLIAPNRHGIVQPTRLYGQILGA
jgi:AAA domain